MADNTDLQYVSALQDFNKSVEILVKAIEQKIKSEGSDMKSAVEATAEQFKSLQETAERIEVIVETTTETKKDTEKILNIVEALKKERKKGLFDKLSPKDKTKSMAEGIKTISLMAGAILAIGGAFKLIGDVDFASVTALSIALPLLAMSFDKVNESGMTPADATIVALNMVIMSAGIVGSGYLLNMMPNIGLPTLISSLGVAVTMGVAMYGLAMVSDILNTKEITQMLLIAAVMPVVAGGILASAYLLQDVPAIDVVGVLEAAVATAGATVLMGLAAGVVGKVANPMQVILGTISLIAAAGGLAASSQLISLGDYTNYPSIDWASGFALSMLAALPAVVGLGLIAATGIGAIAILAGIASMIAVAGGLAATSYIIAGGKYVGGPTKEWSEGVGIAIMAFANALDALEPGVIDMIAGDSLEERILMITKLGAALKTTSFLIAGGKYTGGPSKEWSEGVGIAIMAFANAMDALEPGLIEMLSGESLASRINLMVTLAGKLPLIAAEINKNPGQYDVKNAPSKQWSEGVGTALMAFANAMGALEPGLLATLTGDSLTQRIAMMLPLAAQLPRIAAMFNATKAVYNTATVPSKDWADGVGGSLVGFATSIAALADEVDADEVAMWSAALMPLAPLMSYFGVMLSKGKYDNYPNKDWVTGIAAFYEAFSELDVADNPKQLALETMMLSGAYVKLASSLMILGKSMKGLTELPDLSGLYGGLVTLSLVDEDRLSDVLDVINEKQSEFSRLFEMIKATSTVKIDDSTFAFNKDQKSVKKESPSPTIASNIKSVTAPTPVKVTTPTAARPEKTNQEKILEKIANLLDQLNATMHDVADNTAPKLSISGNIIDN